MSAVRELVREPPTSAADPAPDDMPLVYTRKGVKRRKIRGMDLSAYEKPVIPGNRNAAWRAAWYLVNAFFFQGAILGLIPSSWKAAILRAFGARVGRGLVCKPRVTIKYPWFLELGDHVWLGEMVWIDNHCLVRIGSNVCISQGAYLGTGNHDWNDPAFRFSMAGIGIADECWIGAFATVGSATHLERGSVLGMRYATAPPSMPLRPATKQLPSAWGQ
jgi:putative colanic acid biosynthesis acetyltransferase WcaF